MGTEKKRIENIKSFLSELHSDYQNKKIFHKLSSMSQRAIIYRIDELEDRLEKLEMEENETK